MWKAKVKVQLLARPIAIIMWTEVSIWVRVVFVAGNGLRSDLRSTFKFFMAEASPQSRVTHVTCICCMHWLCPCNLLILAMPLKSSTYIPSYLRCVFVLVGGSHWYFGSRKVPFYIPPPSYLITILGLLTFPPLPLSLPFSSLSLWCEPHIHVSIACC